MVLRGKAFSYEQGTPVPDNFEQDIDSTHVPSPWSLLNRPTGVPRPTTGSYGGAFSCERGTPEELLWPQVQIPRRQALDVAMYAVCPSLSEASYRGVPRS